MRGELRGEGKINSRYRFVVSSSICTVASCCARAPQTDSQTTLFRNYQRFYHSIRKILDFKKAAGDGFALQLIINGASTNGVNWYENNSNADDITVSFAVHACYEAFMLSRDRRTSTQWRNFINHASLVSVERKRRLLIRWGARECFIISSTFDVSLPCEGKATEHGNLSRRNWEFKQIMTFWWSPDNKWIHFAVCLPRQRTVKSRLLCICFQSPIPIILHLMRLERSAFKSHKHKSRSSNSYARYFVLILQRRWNKSFKLLFPCPNRKP